MRAGFEFIEKCRVRTLLAMSVLIAWMLVVAFAGEAVATGGELDLTFGDGGKVATTFADGGAARGLALQTDGAIVAVGEAGEGFGLVRYDSSGVLDPTFGDGGRVTTDFTDGYLDWAEDVAVQSDGKIIAVGHADFNKFALARYNADGTPDETFGGDGKVTSNFHPGTDMANAVAIQADGKIVVAGITKVGPGSGFALARYDPDGTLDHSFGGDGKVTTQFFDVAGSARGVAIQANGKIVAVGEALAGDGFTLARYRTDGSLDPKFGGDGRVVTRFGQFGSGGAEAVAIKSGKIVVAGSAGDIFGPFAVARYTSKGKLDPTFGGDGRATVNIAGGEEAATGVAIQENGRIVAAGYAGIPHEFGDDGTGGFALARFRSNGTLDTSFGGDGKVRTHFDVGMALGKAVVIQADGKIVAAGWAGGYFVLARYLST
jgi:serralysin